MRTEVRKTKVSNGMKINSVGVVGYGAFGEHVAELIAKFAPGVTVKVFSRRYQPDGSKFFSLEEVCQTDAVVLCSAISDYEKELKNLLPLTLPETIIVDVATVKKHPGELLKELANDRQYISCHPMFGPESYKKTGGEVKGFRIVVTDYTLPTSDYQAVKQFLVNCGFVILEMTADEHDKLLADTLFLTHYIGQTMKQAGFLRTDIDTVSFQSLMNAVESVAHDEKLFRDVYDFNPYCQSAAERFHAAQSAVLAKLNS